MKREYGEALAEERDSARSEVRRLKDGLYGSNGRKISEEQRRIHEERMELGRYREEIEADAGRRVASAESRSAEREDRIHEAAQSKTDEALAAQKRSHVEEMKGLYDELAVYRNEGRDVETERAKARHETIDAYEADHLKERNRIVTSYEKTVNRMNERAEAAENLYDRVLADRMIEADARARDMSSRQKTEFNEQFRAQRDDRNRMENYYQNALKDAELRNDSNERSLVRLNQEQTDSALAAKDQVYGDYLERKNEQIGIEMGARDELIQELLTTDDPMRASPMLVKRIQDREQSQYQGRLDAAMNQNARQLEATRDRDQGERAEMRDGFDRRVRDLSRDLRQDSDLRERAMVEAYQDAQFGHERELMDLREGQRNRIEKMHSGHSMEVSNEQRRARDSLEEQRDSLKLERDRIVDRMGFDQKLKDREWAMRVHDIRRDFEDRLSQMKDEQEKTLGQLKYENDKKLREQERTSRRQSDEKDRGYNHRIKEMELAFKERERFLTEHYEAELGKMKRTNAHLIAKKS
jgi:hypothetical protein